MQKIFFLLLILILPQSALALCLGCSCSVTSPSLAFGEYKPLSSSPTYATSTLTLNCFSTLGLFTIPYNISFSTGNSSNFNPRQMKKNAIDTLNYNLYKDAAYSQILGNGANATSTINGELALLKLLQSEKIDFPIYGKIPANQFTVPAGNYTDTVTITVTYD